METVRIRDGKKVGSGIKIPDPPHWFQDEIFSVFRCCSISTSLWYLRVVAAGVRYELAEFHNPIVYVVTPPPLHLVVCRSPRTESLNKNGLNKLVVLLVYWGKTNVLIPVPEIINGKISLS
jgi:hypothetical protein